VRAFAGEDRGAPAGSCGQLLQVASQGLAGGERAVTELARALASVVREVRRSCTGIARVDAPSRRHAGHRSPRRTFQKTQKRRGGAPGRVEQFRPSGVPLAAPERTPRAPKQPCQARPFCTNHEP
jgi:hypothetical protein